MGVLMTGVKGQLGHDVINELKKRDHMTVGVNVEEMNTTNMTSMERIIMEADVGTTICCVAHTAVDVTEDNMGVCRRVNVDGTENVTRVCERLDIKIMYISTDYVFSGQGTRAWESGDKRELFNVYGLTKCEGELTVERHLSKYFIVRTAWVFGVNGKNSTKTMLNLGKIHDSITVVGDQVGSPTYTYDLARLLVDMIETKRCGRYHTTNEGPCSWYEFVCEMLEQVGIRVAVSPVDSVSYPSRTKRPMNSHMSKDKLEGNGFRRLPFWQGALPRYLQEIGY